MQIHHHGGATGVTGSCHRLQITRLNDTSRSILTVEDPIGYYLDGMGQIQVNTKVDLTFARGLRVILRQDPDVVMVGEIRDLETAQIAVHTSLTGHIEEDAVMTVSVHMRDDVVLIFDQDDGGPSVSCAIDSVLASVYEQNPDSPRVVLFCDTEGVYDGVSVDDEGQFQNFYPTRTTDADHAIEVVRAFIVEAPARFH